MFHESSILEEIPHYYMPVSYQNTSMTPVQQSQFLYRQQLKMSPDGSTNSASMHKKQIENHLQTLIDVYQPGKLAADSHSEDDFTKDSSPCVREGDAEGNIRSKFMSRHPHYQARETSQFAKQIYENSAFLAKEEASEASKFSGKKQ